ncbi:hypothetical protein [Streptomyces sp. NPDC006285]|uniref:hypothetical protein n=1 Tax=Streptomyces sp. NPDC006285 TaxID=3364742 RepID=UPI0036C01F1F
MGSLRLALCAGVVAAALSPAYPAYAADGGVFVTPGSPVPGSDIQLRVQGCTGKSGTAASEAFVADARLTGKSGALTGGTRVRSTLDPGTYGVRVTCDGLEDKVRSTVTVLDKKQRDKQEKQEKEERREEREKKERQEKQAQEKREAEEGPERRRDTVPASPVAPVHAGGGGSARVAAEDRSEGPGTRHAVVGLVLASVAVVAVAVSSARRGRGRTD